MSDPDDPPPMGVLQAAAISISRLTPSNHERAPLEHRYATTPVPVIARIVYWDREEWWPAEAIAWSNTLVQVEYRDTRNATKLPQRQWLPASDVKRVIVMPRDDERRETATDPTRIAPRGEGLVNCQEPTRPARLPGDR